MITERLDVRSMGGNDLAVDAEDLLRHQRAYLDEIENLKRDLEAAQSTVRLEKYRAMQGLLMEIAYSQNPWRQRAKDILAGNLP